MPVSATTSDSHIKIQDKIEEQATATLTELLVEKQRSRNTSMSNLVDATVTSAPLSSGMYYPHPNPNFPPITHQEYDDALKSLGPLPKMTRAARDSLVFQILRPDYNTYQLGKRTAFTTAKKRGSLGHPMPSTNSEVGSHSMASLNLLANTASESAFVFPNSQDPSYLHGGPAEYAAPSALTFSEQSLHDATSKTKSRQSPRKRNKADQSSPNNDIQNHSNNYSYPMPQDPNQHLPHLAGLGMNYPHHEAPFQFPNTDMRLHPNMHFVSPTIPPQHAHLSSHDAHQQFNHPHDPHQHPGSQAPTFHSPYPMDPQGYTQFWSPMLHDAASYHREQMNGGGAHEGVPRIFSGSGASNEHLPLRRAESASGGMGMASDMLPGGANNPSMEFIQYLNPENANQSTNDIAPVDLNNNNNSANWQMQSNSSSHSDMYPNEQATAKDISSSQNMLEINADSTPSIGNRRAGSIDNIVNAASQPTSPNGPLQSPKNVVLQNSQVAQAPEDRKSSSDRRAGAQI